MLSTADKDDNDDNDHDDLLAPATAPRCVREEENRAAKAGTRAGMLGQGARDLAAYAMVPPRAPQRVVMSQAVAPPRVTEVAVIGLLLLLLLLLLRGCRRGGGCFSLFREERAIALMAGVIP